MDFDLLPSISLRSSSFNALLAPIEIFVEALNRNLNLQKQYKILYICGNHSSIISLLRLSLPGPGDPLGLHCIPAHDHSGRGRPPLIIMGEDHLSHHARPTSKKLIMLAIPLVGQ